MTPSNSTLASVGIGVPVATLVSWLVSLTGVIMPGPVEAAVGVLISAIVGYGFRGGQANTTLPPGEKREDTF